MTEKEFTCIICPQGCPLKVTKGINGPEISGFKCPRGLEYGLAEAADPRRTLTTTVKVEGGMLERLPVKSSQPIPKRLIFQALLTLEKVTVHAPINMGDLILTNIINSGVDIIATRDIAAKKTQVNYL